MAPPMQVLPVLLQGPICSCRLMVTEPQYIEFYLPRLTLEETNSINEFKNDNRSVLSIDIVSKDTQQNEYYILSLYILKNNHVPRNATAIQCFTRYLANHWQSFCRARHLREGDTVIFSWARSIPRVLLLRVHYQAGFLNAPTRVRTPVGRPRRGSRILGLPPCGDKEGTLAAALILVHMKTGSPFPMTRALYVGDLDPTVNALDLYLVFFKVCNVANVRIWYDFWGCSLCYGYVNLYSSLQASKAMSTMLNHTKLKEKPMRIMWRKRNPITRKTSKANLFVKNLDSSVDSARLDLIFSEFCNVLSCKVAEGGNGKSKGFGFVQFGQEESAIKALNALNDTLLEGKKLYVSNFMKSSQRNQTFTNLYVKSLQKDVSEDDLKELFSKFGKINSAAVMRDGLGNSKGFVGFLSFESPEDAKKAMESLNGTPSLGRDCLYVGRAQKKAERESKMKERLANRKACSVYVNNLVSSVDECMLKSQFSVFGKGVQAKVVHYPNITRAWVTFSSPSEAKIAASNLFGLSSIHRPFDGAKVQCMEGERNYPISVEQSFPANNAAGNVVHLSSQKLREMRMQGMQGLNLHTVNGNIYENHKHLPDKGMTTTCSSTGSSSTTLFNIRSCKNLHVVGPKTEAKYGESTTGIKMKMT